MVIKISNLTKDFDKFRALDNITFNVDKGSLFGLLGPNGSGKSTIIKILTGQIKPTSGSIKVLNKNPVSDPLLVRDVCGIIPEQETPPSFLTAEEYLNFVTDIRKSKLSEINFWFEFLNFKNERNKLCKDLSRGTRQKLMFAQAFLHKPSLAFIDEPLINLDPVIQNKIKKYLKHYVKSGNTIFLSTHILDIAQEICSRIAIINTGKIMYCGNVKKDLDKFFLKAVK